MRQDISFSIGATPFIWEVENRDAFKTFGTNVFNKLNKMKRLPIQHNVKTFYRGT